MFGLDNLIDMLFETAMESINRNERVIQLLKRLNLDPDHPPADFTGVYQYALVEYGVGKSRPVIEIFRQTKIQELFREALERNTPASLLKNGEDFLADHPLQADLQAHNVDIRREFYAFAAVFIEVAKRTRTPAEILAEQKLESLHRQIGGLQERLNRLPTIEGMRTEMARLAAQDYPALPRAAIAPKTFSAEQCKAFALAQQMRGWFETLGFRFESHEVWQDDYFEWIINIPVRRGRYDRILVRGIDGEAGLPDVQDLRQAVATHRTDEGWLVTARRISRAARDEVEKTENDALGCFTFDELLDQDADFSGYLTWLESEIEQRGIDQKYVPLACLKEEIDPDTRQRIGVSRYDDRDGWIDGYIDLWLDDPAKEHISVLGEFGTGKTWFAFHYAWKALQRYRDAQRRGLERPRLPLVVPLRDYAKAVSVESLFSEFFFRKHEIPIPGYSAFEQLNRMGKLLLIFDGFDEMAARVDRQQMINNFWELAKVVVPGAKVILTCRTEHFPEAKEGRALLNAELQASTKDLTGETPQFEVLELEKFNDEQIRQVLSHQAQPATVEQIMGNPELLDLARRPVLTELILEALPDIEAGKPVDMSRVYLYAVRHKMERDIKAERTFTSMADKLYFMCELSWEMLSTDRMSINYREFPDRIRKLFGPAVEEEKDLDHWHYDMMGQTMLIRNAEGDYTPAHRSLLEFFVAYKFAAELGAMDSDFLDLLKPEASNINTSLEYYTWSEYFEVSSNRIAYTNIRSLFKFKNEPLEILKQTIGKSPFSKAIVDLLFLIVSGEEHTLEKAISKVIDLTRGKAEHEVGYLGGNVATLAVARNPSFFLEKDLQNTVLKGADFTLANLNFTNFSSANLSEIRFSLSCQQFFKVLFTKKSDLLTGGGEKGNGEIYRWQTKKKNYSRRFLGHIDTVRILAIRETDWLLASGSADSTIKLWDERGNCLRTLKRHDSPVRALTFSPDGKILVSGGEDQSIYVWNVDTGECIGELLDLGCHIRSLAFSPDGKTLASTGLYCSILLYDFPSLKCERTLRKHQNWIKSIAFSDDGRFLVSGGQDYDVKLWDVAKLECLLTLKGHFRQVNSVALSSDNLYIASGSEDETIRLWRVSDGHCTKIFTGHDNSVQSIAFSPDGKYLASGSQDNSIKFWSLATGENTATLQGRANWINSVSFNPFNGQQIITGGQDRAVRLWDIKTGKYFQEFSGHKDWISEVKFSPIPNYFASCSLDGSAILWKIDSSTPKLLLRGSTEGLLSINFSSDGRILATGGEDSVIRLWDLDTGKCISQFEGHSDRVEFVSFHTEDRILISSSADHTVRFWDIQKRTFLHDIGEYPSWNKKVSFCPSSKYFATANDNYSIKLWSSWAGHVKSELTGHGGQIKSLCFSPNGKVLASGSDDLTIRFWDLNTGEYKTTLSEHSRTINSIDISSDSSLAASASEDGTVRIWNINTADCIQVIRNLRPYEGMNISNAKGIPELEKRSLKALGAIED